MDTATAVQRITGLEFLSQLPENARESVAEVFLNVADVLHFDDGESIITEGYLSFDTGYILLEGSVEIEGHDREALELKAPALLGEMAQFKTADTRTANVRAKGSAVAAQFYWEDLYRAAEKDLPAEAQAAFRDAVEHQTWERFEYQNITALPLLADLPEDLRLKVCMVFPGLSECIRLKEIDTLFNQASVCKSTGYLLVRGKLKLYRKDGAETIKSAPDIMGIFLNKGDKGTEWTATAMASGESEVLKFSWDQYTERLVKRLTRDERHAFVASAKNNATKHFWH